MRARVEAEQESPLKEGFLINFSLVFLSFSLQSDRFSRGSIYRTLDHGAGIISKSSTLSTYDHFRLLHILLSIGYRP